MESDDDFELLPSSPVHERKLKRLKKANRAHKHSHPSSSPTNFSELGDTEPLEESIGPEPEILGLSPQLDSVKDYGLSAKRVLDFDSVAEELDGEVAEENEEFGSLNISEEVGDLKTSEEIGDLKTSEEVRDLKTDESERKQRSSDESSEKKEKKKKKRRMDDGDGSEKMAKESVTNKRKAQKVHPNAFSSESI